jgi:group I intron endonuclease
VEGILINTRKHPLRGWFWGLRPRKLPQRGGFGRLAGPLQRSFERFPYGKQNFTLYILAWVELSTAKTEKGLPREEIMISYEQKYMDLLKPTYNFSQLAGIKKGRLGIKHSEASKELMSERMKGKNIGKIPINKGIKLKDEEKRLPQLASRSKHRKKPVYFYDDYNNLVTIYDSLNATCRGENCNKTATNLLNCIKTGKLFRGWLVCYKPIR